jgi:L-threonylcarbamoyladenylate synthase
MDTILFVCTGNTCRSPMAEAIAQHCFDEGLLGEDRRYQAASAGVSAPDGSPPTPEALAALKRLGIDHSGRSKPLSAEMIRRARIVLCMTAGHVETAGQLVHDEPQEIAKILRLDPEEEIADPIGRGQDAYDSLAQRLMKIVPQRLKEVLAREDRAGIRPPRR